MSANEIVNSMETLTGHYLEELERYPLEQLKQQPGEEEWSLGQMYVHLINSALYMQLRNADTCLTSKEPVHTVEGKTDAGKAVFDLGGFPPIQIKAPASPQYTPSQPESKEQIVDGMRAVIRRMKELEPLLADANLSHTAQHPRLGALNAREWFALVEMHYRHHLLQKDRLKAYLARV
ncbi:DinB family protein [Paenibacillus sp. OAS669]|uniref:DinB family protein n=1 Tax=Paenibacillus sp. OAS669 TaxID=2663821 RepID=UPI00178AEB21|nr:DinB family protein [Paenibacillus sp. OAS669]MBE1442082.1 uncharacterized protein YkwD [Paenibacillus sp. OAS669]